jgi:hypothetical protein
LTAINFDREGKVVQFNDKNIQELFGVEDAENESPNRLKEYFYRNKAYENLVSDLPIRVLVGHKGVGKSALLKVAHLEDLERKIISLWLQPDDVRSAIKLPSDADLNSLIDFWKTGLINLIFHKVIESLQPSFQSKAAQAIKGSVAALLQSLTDFCQKQAGVPTTEAMKALIDGVNPPIIRVYLDDLDRGWEAKPDDIKKISALLNAIRDLCGSSNRLQFRLGLRSDVYFLVRTSDESTDKIERNLIILTWSNHEILTVFAKRIETFFGRPIDERDLISRKQSDIAKYLHSVMAPRFHGRGKWENIPIHRVLLSLTRKRPRDFVKLCYGGARSAFKQNREIIASEDFNSIFESYSNERLQDIINEFKTELPQISNLVRGMRPTRREKSTIKEYLYSNDQLSNKLRNLMGQNRFEFTNGTPATPNSLAQFLYKIDFITARKDHQDGVIVRKFFDQNQYLKDQFVDFGFSWEVHPAYRWALEPEDTLSIFDRLDLEKEE